MAEGILPSWSNTLVEFLQLELAGRRPGIIALFGGLSNEPDLWQRLGPELRKAGWTTALFHFDLTHHSMQAFAADESRAMRGPQQVWVPDAVALDAGAVTPDWVLVPGLAFSPTLGTRLGRGGGFYDRYLSAAPSATQFLGVCFECQLADPVPAGPHDLRVPRICTERGCLTMET